MKKEIIINATSSELRVAITEDSRLAELFLELPDRERHVGSIFLGRVERVVQGMNAAFVDIGLEQHAFLHFSDAANAGEDYSDLLDDDDDDDDVKAPKRAGDANGAPRGRGRGPVKPPAKPAGRDERPKDGRRPDGRGDRRDKAPLDPKAPLDAKARADRPTADKASDKPVDGKPEGRRAKPTEPRTEGRGTERPEGRADEKRPPRDQRGRRPAAGADETAEPTGTGRADARRGDRNQRGERPAPAAEGHPEGHPEGGEPIEKKAAGRGGDRRAQSERPARGERPEPRRREETSGSDAEGDAAPPEKSGRQPRGPRRETQDVRRQEREPRGEPLDSDIEGERWDDALRGHRAQTRATDEPMPERNDERSAEREGTEAESSERTGRRSSRRRPQRPAGAEGETTESDAPIRSESRADRTAMSDEPHDDGDGGRADSGETTEGTPRKRSSRRRGGRRGGRGGGGASAAEGTGGESDASAADTSERRERPEPRAERKPSGDAPSGDAPSGREQTGDAGESAGDGERRSSRRRRPSRGRGGRGGDGAATGEGTGTPDAPTGERRESRPRTDGPNDRSADGNRRQGEPSDRSADGNRRQSESSDRPVDGNRRQSESSDRPADGNRRSNDASGAAPPATEGASAEKRTGRRRPPRRGGRKPGEGNADGGTPPSDTPSAPSPRRGDKPQRMDAALPTFLTRRHGEITISLERGKEILTQVTRESYASKGVKVSTKISLPGRFLVLMPLDPGIGISRKVADVKERRRLRGIAKKILPDGFGCIIRTVAMDKDSEMLEQELRMLLDRWRTIEEKLKDAKAPKLVYQDQSVANTVMRDLFTPDVSRVLIDNKPLYQEIHDYISWAAPTLANKVELYTGKAPIFQHAGIESELDKMLATKVWLPHGGYIILEQTEAMMVIDVNSGRYAKEKEQELNALRINLESAREIARQIRLRDIGGLIVVDFIDLYEEKNRKKVYDELKKEMARDRAKSVVLPMTQFGIVQMTRQRVRQQLVQTMSEPCPTCNGKGIVQSKGTILRRIERWLADFRADSREFRLTLTANPHMIDFLTEGETMSRLTKMMLKHFVRIKVVPDESLDMEDFRFFSVRRQADITKEYLVDGVKGSLNG